MQIELKGVSFRYKKTVPVIENISYTFTGGNIYFLTGENGAGITTLSKLMTGLLKPISGIIEIDGESIEKKNIAQISEEIGYLFQNPELQLFANSVWEELSFPYEIMGVADESLNEKIETTLEKFGLYEYKDNFPLLLSGGEKQRLALATIFMRPVGFLILDEPTSAIDKGGKEFLSKIVGEYVKGGGGVIIITHDQEFVEFLPESIMLRIRDGLI
jgi:energy-coupling factor transport system ATP-binding protein